MNSKLSAIFARRSIRKYTDQHISDEAVHDLLEAAMAAPSPAGTDSWHFIVIRNPATLTALAAAMENGRHLAHAGVGILVCTDPARAHEGRLEHAVQECSAAMTQLLLAASMTGLSGCWCSVHPHEDRVKLAHSLLGIPAPILPVAIAAIGWPAERAEPRTRFRANRVHDERW
ncbi:MAG TPA: nitroreductase family protein [Kiritimatiellia bacterium]|nr:nitroreductase family protein [Kiritimatiellia bacterium]